MYITSRDHGSLARTTIRVANRLCCQVKLHRAILFLVALILSYRVICPSNRQKLAAPTIDDIDTEEKPAIQLAIEKWGNEKMDEKQSFEMLLKSIQRSYASLLKQDDMTDPPTQQSSAYIYVRSFPRYNYTFPCVKPEENWNSMTTTQRRPTQEGLLYVKTFKTASTTVAGVTIRIALKAAARHNELRKTNYKLCKTRFEHWPAYMLQYRKRKRNKSFLFAILREPTQRAISMFFHFIVSREKQQPLDANFKKYLTRPCPGDKWYKDYYPWGWPYDHYLHFLSPDGFHIDSEKNNSSRRIQTVNKILKEYDFIGVTERLDESLVALQMILGLKTSDILYYSAKNKGGWDDHGVYIQPSFVSEGMQKFFASEAWRELSKGDYLMYAAASASLDRTIESLGREEFNEKLAYFKFAKNLVVENCTDVFLLYSAAGKAKGSDCLYTDAGCGNRCFDRLEKEFNL